jgi:hypothetical protein
MTIGGIAQERRCASTEDFGAGFGDDFGALIDLLPRFDLGGAGHHNDLFAADLQAGSLYYRSAGTEDAAGKFVGADDAVSLFDAFHYFEDGEVEIGTTADAAEHRVHDAGGTVNIEN